MFLVLYHVFVTVYDRNKQAKPKPFANEETKENENLFIFLTWV